MVSELHMSRNQAINSTIIVGNELFGQQWRKYDKDDEITLDTVPNKKRNREVGKCYKQPRLHHQKLPGYQISSRSLCGWCDFGCPPY